MKTKQCSKCGQEKPLNEFHRSKKGKYGRKSQCKECINKYNHNLYFKNEEFHEKEKKRCRGNMKKNYWKNPKKQRLRRKKYRIKNKDDINSKKKIDVKMVKKWIMRKYIKNKYKIPYDLISDDMIERERKLITINRLLRSKKDVGKKKIV